MNAIVLIGRLTKDVELRQAGDKQVSSFTLAVNRDFSKDKKADFFRVVVWGKQAEPVARYLRKGSQCAVNGRVELNSYTDKEGNTRYTTDIIADRVEFLSKAEKVQEDDFPTIDDGEVPF